MKKLFKILIVASLVLCGLYLFLISPRMINKPDMSPFTGWFYAHRGYYDNESSAPENSMPAFAAAIENGYAIELDVRLSKDGVAMVFHDADLERMCGVQGNIWDYTCRELQQMKLLDTDETIPTFEQVLDFIAGRVPVLVEYKMDLVDTTVCEKGQEILDGYDGDYFIQSFDPRVLLWYRQNAPQVVRGQLSEEFWKEEKYAGKPLYTALAFMVENVLTRPDFISYNFADRDNISLKLCRMLGAETACWTLQSPRDYRQVKGSFDMYIFDSFAIADCQ